MPIRTQRPWTLWLAAALALGVIAMGCEPEPTPEAAPPVPPLAAGFEVRIVDNAFEPSAIELTAVPATVADDDVLPGPLAVDQATVRFVNRGEVAHTVTFDFLDTGELQPGGIAEISFAGFDAGTYEYRCTIHPEMTGEITVLE